MFISGCHRFFRTPPPPNTHTHAPAIVVTSITMVLVGERVPDPKTHPPLPDLLLDNIPYIPWAFPAAEVCGLVLLCMLFVILVFHKHRAIIMRRVLALAGTLFLLRCITMICTSLSVPNAHGQCREGVSLTWDQRKDRVLEILKGFVRAARAVSLLGVSTSTVVFDAVLLLCRA